MADSELVFPGDEVAVEEEYLASNGTYAENGIIYASQIGVLELDDDDCVARVISPNPPNILAVGDIVYAVVADIRNTVFMNPPFGCQNRNADRPFLRKAMEISECVYSIHMADTVDFVKGFCEENGRSVVSSKIYKYEIPHTFSFHTKTKKTVDVAVVNIR